MTSTPFSTASAPISAPFSALACPLDGTALGQEGGAWRCVNGHSFDVAREGYIHLLPVQKKRSRDPGDSKAMVAARRRFLNAGHYAPVADAVAAMIFSRADTSRTLSCLDAGCGEGYYLRRLLQSVNTETDTDIEAGSPSVSSTVPAHGPALALLGLDISKWAIAAAARQDSLLTAREQSARWVVGSNANLPVLPESLDCILCLFGFPVYPEFARCLKDGGLLILADAGPDHLRELREIIYPALRPPRPGSPVREPFKSIDTRPLRYRLALRDPQSVQDLLTMTPHLYRANAEGRARALALQTLTVEIDVTLRLYELRKAPAVAGAG